MSVTRRIVFGAGASWFGRGVTILLGLVLLPVLFRNLPKEELGVWLLLGQSWAALGILDLGFGVTLTRRIALAKGKSGGDPNAPLTDGTLRDIADLVTCGRRIYPILAAGVFTASWIAGYFYLRNLHLHEVSHYTVWIAWSVLCLCQAVNVWSTVWDCLLNGVGYIGWDAIIASLASTITLSAQIIAVLCGGRLVSLAVIATVGALLQRFSIRWFARKRRPELFALRGRWNPQVLKGMPGLAFRAWLTSIGGILAFNTDQFFIAGSQGAGAIPAYRAAYLAVLNLNMLAVTFASASAVFVSHMWQADEMEALHRLVSRNVRLGLLIILCGSGFLITLGHRVFDVWIGPGRFIGYPTLLVFIVLLVLQTQSYIIVTSARATEEEAFAGSAIAGGILKLIFSWLLMLRFGLVGIAAGTLLSQLLTNHWYMVYRGLRRLRMSLRQHLGRVIVPCLGIFVIVLSADFVWLKLAQGSAQLGQVVGAGLITLFIFSIACWRLVLSLPERAYLVSIKVAAPLRFFTGRTP